MRATVLFTVTRVKLQISDGHGFTGSIDYPRAVKRRDGKHMVRGLGEVRHGQEFEVTFTPVADDRE